jgi:hypothetical protein
MANEDKLKMYQAKERKYKAKASYQRESKSLERTQLAKEKTQYAREKLQYKQSEESRKREEAKKKHFLKDISKITGRQASESQSRWKQEYASKGKGKIEYVGAWKSTGLASQNAYNSSDGINSAFKSNSFRRGR